CVNSAMGFSIKMEDLPRDGSDMITKRIESTVKTRYGPQAFDKRRVFAELLKRFDTWNKVTDLPEGTQEKATKLFKTINNSLWPTVADTNS
ncbi:MAG: hypothetical protein ACREJN_01835, partial [Nitrospiraceae bacterium]